MALEDFNTGKEEADSTDETEQEQAGTKREFTQFTREEFEECLENTDLDFEQVNLEHTKELVYEAKSRQGKFVMRVYSSLSRSTGKARKKGSDAIRTVVLHVPSDRPVLKEKRTNRIKTWCANLSRKIENLQNRRDELKFCPECGRLMVIRSTDTGDRFWGCTGWSADEEKRVCSNTEPLN